MSVGEVAAILRARVAQVRQQRAVAVGVLRTWERARDALHRATNGAGSLEAARGVRALSEGIEALVRAVEHLGAVSEHIAAYGPALGVDLGDPDAGAGTQQAAR